MQQEAQPKAAQSEPLKDLYEVGEIPPLGHVPKQMYAWAIREERHGEPDQVERACQRHTGRGARVVRDDPTHQRHHGERDGEPRDRHGRLRRAATTTKPCGYAASV